MTRHPDGTATFAMTAIVHGSFDNTLSAVRQALVDHGFGVLTEIDMRATLKVKLDVDIAPQVILGACRPPLAYAALQAEPDIGLLLPCNIVVRAGDDGTILVQALNPDMMVSMTGNAKLVAVAADASARLSATLDSLHSAPQTS